MSRGVKRIGTALARRQGLEVGSANGRYGSVRLIRLFRHPTFVTCRFGPRERRQRQIVDAKWGAVRRPLPTLRRPEFYVSNAAAPSSTLNWRSWLASIGPRQTEVDPQSVVTARLQWPLAKYNGRSFSDSSGSTSAMWLIADDGGIEQPGGSILHQ